MSITARLAFHFDLYFECKRETWLFILLSSCLSLSDCAVLQKMDLETYESDLADYSLQDSPFYEASRPMVFDLSMSGINSLMAADVASGSGKNAFMLKMSTSNHATTVNAMPSNYTTTSTNGQNGHRSNGETQSMRFDMSHRHGIIGIPNGNNSNRVAPIPLELTANTSSNAANGSEPTKKKRKCVSFLPNYVQVSINITSSY